MWANHTWRKQGSLFRLVIKDPIEKNTLKRTKLRWKYWINKGKKLQDQKSDERVIVPVASPLKTTTEQHGIKSQKK